RNPILHGRRLQSRGVGNGRNVQQQIRRTTKRRMHHHRILNTRGAENFPCENFSFRQFVQCSRRTLRQFQPHRLTRRSERRVRQRQSQCFTNHLCRRRRTEKLTASARRTARTTAQIRRFR